MTGEHEISSFIRAVRELTGIGICFYDTQDFFHYRKNGERAYSGHYCDFCRFARDMPGGRIACDKSDRDEAATMATIHRAPFFKKCHMGLCELVVPVLRGGCTVGLIFLGQCRIAGEDATEEVAARAAAMGGDGVAFSTLYAALPEIGREHLMALGRVFALYFSRPDGDGAFFSHVASEAEGRMTDRACRFIEENYYRDLTPAAVSAQFYLNAAYFARLFHREVGITPGAYIRAVRHAHACRLLANRDLPIGHVALNVGYTDTAYFCRVFKKQAGMTPSEYREKNRPKED